MMISLVETIQMTMSIIILIVLWFAGNYCIKIVSDKKISKRKEDAVTAGIVSGGVVYVIITSVNLVADGLKNITYQSLLGSGVKIIFLILLAYLLLRLTLKGLLVHIYNK